MTAFGMDQMHTLELFFFLGKVVGKSIYENCLLEPQFSRVFLNMLLNRKNSLDDVLKFLNRRICSL